MALPRKNKFTLGSDRDEVFSSGRIFSGRFITIKVLATGSNLSHMAIFVPMKVAGKAVARNKIRRKISEAIKAIATRMKPGFDVVVLAKTDKLPSNAEIMEDALTLWGKSDMLKQ